MNTEFDNPTLITQQTFRDSLGKNRFKNWSKHNNCSECRIVLTGEIYKKDRTICK